MSTKVKSKKEKSKISKLIEKSDSENEENEHELSFYINDRVKLMKEVLKIIKPKKIKTMAPDCIKDLDIEEINSMLLEELLGISNKRLKYIFNGQNSNEDSSSTDPEEEKQPIDIISLDDVSEDDFVVEVTTDGDQFNKTAKKGEPKVKKVKKEKQDKKSSKRKDGPLEEENLMSVLELLELQARARAIRSQLTLEASKKNAQPMTEVKLDEDSDNDIIIEIPKREEIVINSSDSEVEQKDKESETSNSMEKSPQRKKITLVRDRVTTQTTSNTNTPEVEKATEKTTDTSEVDTVTENNDEQNKDKEDESRENPKTVQDVDANTSNSKEQEPINDEDEIILIVDQEEMKGIMED